MNLWSHVDQLDRPMATAKCLEPSHDIGLTSTGIKVHALVRQIAATDFLLQRTDMQRRGEHPYGVGSALVDNR